MTATPEQLAAGRRWAARYRRYPARTDRERLDDFSRVEALHEAEQDRHR